VNDTAAEPKHQKTLIDLNYEYETGSGRVIVDPVEAEVELGKALASQLKLDKTGKVVLWPQPSDDRHDPQNWPKNRKLKNLIISTMAAFIPDFDSGIGVACLFPLAREYRTTPGELVNFPPGAWRTHRCHVSKALWPASDFVLVSGVWPGFLDWLYLCAQPEYLCCDALLECFFLDCSTSYGAPSCD